MNSRILVLFLLIAGFIAIWSEDQKQSELYLAAQKQESNELKFTLNCFPEQFNIHQKLQQLDQWTEELAKFDPSRMRSIDKTIKDFFPSPLQTATLCPMEEEFASREPVVAPKPVSIDSEQTSITSIQIHSTTDEMPAYLIQISKLIEWFDSRQEEVTIQKEEENPVPVYETSLLDRIADDVVESVMETSRQIRIMAESYQQTLDKIQRSSQLAVEPKENTRIQ